MKCPDDRKTYPSASGANIKLTHYRPGGTIYQGPPGRRSSLDELLDLPPEGVLNYCGTKPAVELDSVELVLATNITPARNATEGQK